MNKEVEYWKWKNTIIDFDNISDEKDEYGSYATKKDIVFHYLGTPDNDIHEWYNGGFSSEYNTALRYGKQLGLIEDYIDYEEELYKLQQENNQLKDLLYKKYYSGDTPLIVDIFDKMNKKRISDLETIIKELRSWLEEYKENASNSLDSYDCGIADCLEDVLNKLNELEGKNE